MTCNTPENSYVQADPTVPWQEGGSPAFIAGTVPAFQWQPTIQTHHLVVRGMAGEILDAYDRGFEDGKKVAAGTLALADLQEILKEVGLGRKIQAIKALRTASSMSLYDAKNMIELAMRR